jgi:hypothetical protein
MQIDDLVNVMVPRRYLSQVYGLIARLDDGGAQPSSSDGSPAPAGASAGGANGAGASATVSDEWTPSRLRRAVRESSPALREIFMALADKPGQWLSMPDLAAAIGPTADWKTVAGTLGAFGRRLKSRYGLEKAPFENRHDHALGGRVCSMSHETAKLIKQFLAEG